MEMNLTDVIIRLSALTGKPIRIMIAPLSEIKELQASFDGKCKHSIVLSGKLSYRGEGVWNIGTKDLGEPFYASDIAFFEAYDVVEIRDAEPPMIFVAWG